MLSKLLEYGHSILARRGQDKLATILQCSFFFRKTVKHFVTERYLPADGLARSKSGRMVWYDMGGSVVWKDKYPSGFFTLHIHISE